MLTCVVCRVWVIGPNLQEKDEKADYGLQRDFTYRPLCRLKELYFFVNLEMFFFYLFLSLKMYS